MVHKVLAPIKPTGGAVGVGLLVGFAGAAVCTQFLSLNMPFGGATIFQPAPEFYPVPLGALDKDTALPHPTLQGKAYRGKDVNPCVRCRGLANKAGLLRGGRDAVEPAGSSSSEASSVSE